jgi:hypothetical protein
VAEAAATAGQESADLFGRVCGIVQPESVVILFFVANPWLKMWLKFSGGMPRAFSISAADMLEVANRSAQPAQVSSPEECPFATDGKEGGDARH